MLFEQGPSGSQVADRRGRAGAIAAPNRSLADLHLETDRLELRALTFDDLDDLASMLGDAKGLVHWGPPLGREESRSWIERNRRRYRDDGFGRCAIILRSTGEFVGDCGLARMLVEGQPVVELGWIVRRAHRGKGIATEPPPHGGTTRSTPWARSGSCRW